MFVSGRRRKKQVIFLADKLGPMLNAFSRRPIGP
jgi:hypothetical protein